MNAISIKITSEDVYQALLADYHFQTIGIDGATYFQKSKDLSSVSLARIIQEHEFVEAVSKSSGPAFVFEKTLSGSTLTKSLPISRSFYDLLAIPKGDTLPSHEPSGYSKVLSEVAHRLNLPSAQFSGNPLSPISVDGLLEGELVNTLVARLREAVKRKSLRDAILEQKRLTTQRFSTFRRYLHRLIQNCPNLYVFRLDFGYTVDAAAGITNEKSATHLNCLLSILESDHFFNAFAGYWWRREYLSEVGNRYHLILFVDSQKSPCDQAFLQSLWHRWNDITEGKGMCYNHPYRKDDYRSWGAGPVHNLWQDNQGLLLRGVKLMLAGECYLRLKKYLGTENDGMGKLPKLVDRTISGLFHPRHLESERCQVAQGGRL